MSAFFITGTDTGIGKTLVSCALLRAFAQQGFSVAGMKPVAAGSIDGELLNEDVRLLLAASNVVIDKSLVNPYLLLAPVAPHIAAVKEKLVIDLAVIVSAFVGIQKQAEVVIVEGVGGFKVPLGEGCDTVDLARALGLPLILVVGMRLGCLNHALLTVAEIARTGLSLAGWVANCIDDQMLCLQENIETLTTRIPAPLIGVVPYQSATSLVAIEQFLHLEKLIS